MQFLLLTKSTTFIIGPVASLLGYIMDLIFRFTSMFGIVNIGLGVIIFTIIIKLLMFPMTVSQQKFTKMSAYINPEVQAVQAKYKGKTDQESLMKQNMELSAIYQKYGSKPTAGCLPLLIQLPIIFALYRVVWNIPAYVASIKNIYLEIVTELTGKYANYAEILEQTNAKLVTDNRVALAEIAPTAADYSNKLIDMMYNFDASEWKAFQELFPNLAISDQVSKIESMNSFFGLSLYNSPWTYVTGVATFGIGLAIIASLIPLLAGLLQWITTKITQVPQAETKKKLGQPEEESAMMQSMKMMTKIMPIMSIVFCFTFSACIGVYWVMSSVATIICQLIVNKTMGNMDVNEIVAKNLEKVNAKRAKQGLPPQKFTKVTVPDPAQMQRDREAAEQSRKDYGDKIKKSTEYYNSSSNYKSGSLTAKANMVKQYDDKRNKGK